MTDGKYRGHILQSPTRRGPNFGWGKSGKKRTTERRSGQWLGGLRMVTLYLRNVIKRWHCSKPIFFVALIYIILLHLFVWNKMALGSTMNGIKELQFVEGLQRVGENQFNERIILLWMKSHRQFIFKALFGHSGWQINIVYKRKVSKLNMREKCCEGQMKCRGDQLSPQQFFYRNCRGDN